MHRVLCFLSDPSGAVTVDWVVMAAAVTGLGVASVAAVRGGTTALASDMESSLSSASVVSLGRFNPREVLRSFGESIGDISVFRNGGNNQISWSSMNGPDGQPGVLMFNDIASNDAWVTLGADFAGNHADKYGGSLSWDINIVGVSGQMVPAGSHFLELSGANGLTLTYAPPENPPTGQWSTLSIPLSSGSLRLSNGTVASEAQIRSVLENVQRTAIRLEYVNGGEQIAFDNIRFN